MNTIKRLIGRSGNLLAAVAFIVALAAPLVVSESAFAAGQFTSRKLTMSSQTDGNTSTDANGTAVTAGNGGNGAKAVHTFSFTIGTTGNEGSYSLQYCTTPLFGTTCTAPTGMDASTITTIGAQTGFVGGVFALDTSFVANAGTVFTGAPCSGSSPYRLNCILVKRTAASETAPLAVTLGFGVSGTNYIKNPTAVGPFYVRITSFSDNAYTTIVDQAAVAGSVNTNIDITAKVQEKLNFSVGANWVAPTGACTALSGTGSVLLGDTNGVLDFATQYDQHTYFRLSTNAQNGTVVLYSGDTLKTAGATSTIASLGTTAITTTAGTEGFGLGIDSGDAGKYSFTNLTATAPYASANGATLGSGPLFAFNTASVATPAQIASASAGNVVTCDTGSVRYVGNIATTTKAGVYKTTIAYIAVPTF